MELYFLTYEDVISIHTDQIKRYGRKSGLRDENLFLPAIALPQIGLEGQYLHNTIFDKAAAHLFTFVKTIHS